MKRGSVQARSLETVSAVFDESAKSDERKFISVVEQKRGQHGQRVELEGRESSAAHHVARQVPDAQLIGAEHEVELAALGKLGDGLVELEAQA